MARSKTTWRKGGPSPNPQGRPVKALTLADVLETALAEQVDVTDEGAIITKLHVIARLAVDAACGGDKDARTFVADRRYGRPPSFADLAIVDRLEKLEQQIARMIERANERTA